MYFFLKTDIPRLNFHLDMNEEERGLMAGHVQYWTDRAAEGVVVVFGPVADPAGAYGIGVYRAESPAAMEALVAGDPANGLLRISILPMSAAVIGTEVQARRRPSPA